MMARSALERLRSEKPYIAAQGAMMCVVNGAANAEEAAAIVRLSKIADDDIRIAGRTIHDWITAAMAVLGIEDCNEDKQSDTWELIAMMKDRDWIADMRQILSHS